MSSENKRLMLNLKDSRWSKRRRWPKLRQGKSPSLLLRPRPPLREPTERWFGRTTRPVDNALLEPKELSREEVRLTNKTNLLSTNPQLEEPLTRREQRRLLRINIDQLSRRSTRSSERRQPKRLPLPRSQSQER